MGAIERAQAELAEKMSEAYIDRAEYKEKVAHEESPFALGVPDDASEIEQSIYEGAHVSNHLDAADSLYAEAERLEEWQPTESED